MDLVADRGRRVTIEELNTSQLLAHARKQAVQRIGFAVEGALECLELDAFRWLQRGSECETHGILCVVANQMRNRSLKRSGETHGLPLLGEN